MKNLSARLNAALLMMPTVHTAADIGCDHGQLALEMVRSGKCEKVIVSDISDKCLGKARVAFAEGGFFADFRCGNGLQVLGQGEAQCAVVAGMGGRLIADILGESHETALSLDLVLQPMQQPNDLRRFLRQNGFNIENESMVLDDGRYYATILANAGAEKSSLDGWIYDEVGPVLFSRRDGMAFDELKHRIAVLEKNCVGAGNGSEIFKKIEILKRIEKRWQDVKK